jgi:hypothetical protein
MNTTSLEQFLENCSEDMIFTTQCASLCSLFVSEPLLTATTKQIATALNKRHNNLIDERSLYFNVMNALQYGIDKKIFDCEEGQYVPTDIGWTIGKDWNMRLQQEKAA